MANYLLLIYVGEDEKDAEPTGEVSSPFRGFMERNAGSLRGGAALYPAGTATAVRGDDSGGRLVTDGPFAETKEAIGGYFLIEAADLDEALAVAKDVPIGSGGVEVRPVWMTS